MTRQRDLRGVGELDDKKFVAPGDDAPLDPGKRAIPFEEDRTGFAGLAENRSFPGSPAGAGIFKRPKTVGSKSRLFRDRLGLAGLERTERVSQADRGATSSYSVSW